jgi:hypothetical protein
MPEQHGKDDDCQGQPEAAHQPVQEAKAPSGDLTDWGQGPPPRRRRQVRERPSRPRDLDRLSVEQTSTLSGSRYEPADVSHHHRGRVERLSTVVSSLRIKWFPLEAQRAILEPCLDWLGPGGQFLQVTNSFSSPLSRDRLGVCGRAWAGSGDQIQRRSGPIRKVVPGGPP